MLRQSIKSVLRTALRAKGLRVAPGMCIRDLTKILFNHVERDVVRVAKGIVRKGDVVLDVGANMGLTARIFSRLVGPGGKVFAFEPDPKTAELLRHNVRHFPQCVVTTAAVSEKPGQATFHVHPTSIAGSSLVSFKDCQDTITVPCVSMDQFIEDNKIGRIALVKIDVEGGESLVLKGFSKTLQQSPKLPLIIEFAPDNLRNAGITPDEFFKQLRDAGLDVAWTDDNGVSHPAASAQELVSQLNPHGYLNLLCVKS